MADIVQNTLYLTTPGTYVARDHLTLLVKVPLRPDGSPVTTDELKSDVSNFKSISIPIHNIESICVFGPSAISPPALNLCWEHGVAVNFLSEHGHLQARLVGVPDTSVTLRHAQFRAADDPVRCALVARNIIAGKLQNARNSLLRAARESGIPDLKSEISTATDALARLINDLGRFEIPTDKAQITSPKALMDTLRGIEGMGTAIYFAAFNGLLKQQREAFAFAARTHRPPRDRINCLLSFIYALLGHDCIAALTAIGLDPFVGFLHVERPNRPALALDLMEEFRPWLADRLAVTLINRQQIAPHDFNIREGGAVELTDAARKCVITAWQQRKQERLFHPLLDREFRIGQLPFVQARILARHLRNDIPDYVPFVPK